MTSGGSGPTAGEDRRRPSPHSGAGLTAGQSAADLTPEPGWGALLTTAPPPLRPGHSPDVAAGSGRLARLRGSGTAHDRAPPPHAHAARAYTPPHDSTCCPGSETELRVLHSCCDEFLMAIFAEEAGRYCLACHREKPSSLPRGKDGRCKGSGLGASGDSRFPPTTHAVEEGAAVLAGPPSRPRVPAHPRAASEPRIPAAGTRRRPGLVGTPGGLWEGRATAPRARRAGGWGPPPGARCPAKPAVPVPELPRSKSHKPGGLKQQKPMLLALRAGTPDGGVSGAAQGPRVGSLLRIPAPGVGAGVVSLGCGRVLRSLPPSARGLASACASLPRVS